jgi:hypothetical protein
MPFNNMQNEELASAVVARQQAKRRKEIERTQGQRLLARAGMDIQRQYANNFMGLEHSITNTATGRDAGDALGRVQNAQDTAGRDADIASSAMDRERAALGIGGVSQATTRRLGLSRVLAQVDAGNRTADANVGRQKAAQQYGAQQWGANATDAVNTLAQIAQSEADRYSQYRKAKIDRKGAIVGTIAGIGGAAIGAFA